MSENLEKELRRLRDERQKKFNEEDWEGALEIHDRILELSPSALRYANKGSILFRLGKLEDAIESYKKALEMEPTLNRARADLERLEAQYQQQKQQALQEEEEKKQQEAEEEKYEPAQIPQHQIQENEERQALLEEWRIKRQEAMQKSDWEEALKYHNQILETAPSASRYTTQGSIYYRMGQIQNAAESYRKALEMDPSLQKARKDLKKLESQLEEEKLWAQNQEENQEEKEEENNLPAQLEKLRKERQENIEKGDWNSALAIHDQILELEPTALRYANRGGILYQMGRIKEAIQSYEKALEIDPNLTKIREDLQRLEAHIEEEKLMAMSVESQINPSEGMSQQERIQKISQLKEERQKYLDAKDWKKALELHDEIIQLEPTALRYVNRASMLYRMKKLEESAESYRKAIELDPNLGRAKMDLERIEKELSTQAREQEKKLKELEIAKSVSEKLEELRQERQKWISQDRWEEALQCQNRIIDLEPTAARCATKGSICYNLGKANEAILSFRQAIDIDPSYQEAQKGLEKLRDSEMDRLRVDRQKAMDKENWQKALEIHDIIIALEPTALRYANRGSILYRMNCLPEAIAAYEKALELDPDMEKAKEDIEQLQEEMKNSACSFSSELEEEEEDFQLEEIEESDIEDIEPAISVEESQKEEKETREIQSLFTWTGHEAEITELTLSSDGKWLVSASKDKTVRIWDIKNKSCLHTLQGHTDWVRSVLVNADNTKIISASDDWTIKVWDIKTGVCETTLEGHIMPVTALAIPPMAGKSRFFFSASRDHTVKVWDVQNYRCMKTLEAHKDWVTCLFLPQEGNKVISASLDGSICMWHVLGWRSLNVFQGNQGPVRKILLSLDSNKIFSLAQEQCIFVWDTGSGKLLEKWEGHKENITDIALSPDGQYLASSGRDQTVRIWDIANNREVQTYFQKNAHFEKVLFSEDSQWLFAIEEENKIYVWRISDGENVAVWNEHKKSISNFSLFPSKKWLFSSGKEGCIKVWDYSKLSM